MNDLFLRACRREPVPRTPVWLMRQAGRYLPEYREVRARVDFRTLCSSPDLATEVTLQPLARFELDAAIVFADIMTPVESMGVEIDFAPGPLIEKPLRSRGDVERLRVPPREEIAPTTVEAVGLLARELETRVPLIGFAGAPLTLAAYLVEGKGSKDFNRLRSFLYQDPGGARLLLDKLARVMGLYLRAQVEAGAQAVQLFDSWAGILSRRLYEEFELPAVRQVLEAVGDTVPRIYFAPDAAAFGDLPSRVGAQVIGVDWRTDLAVARKTHGDGFAYQGNLDPAALRAPLPRLEKEVIEVLRSAPERGHVFNLGHGILPDTPIDAVHRVLEVVHRETGEG